MSESMGLGAGGLASGMGMPGSNPLLGAMAAQRQPFAGIPSAPGMPSLANPLPAGGGLGGSLGGLSSGLGGLMSPTPPLQQQQLAQLLSQPGALQALIAARGQGAS